MSKGKDISTMFTKEENRKNGRLGYGQDTREEKYFASFAQYREFLRQREKVEKKVKENENEQISISVGNTRKLP